MRKNKILTNAVISLFIGFSVFGYATRYAKAKAQNISSNVIRFHVLANSNSSFDQSLKLKVRDEVVSFVGSITKNCTTYAEAKGVIIDNLQIIADKAASTVEANGYSYPVKVSLKHERFPTRNYEDIRLPSGEYEALRIFIGSGTGENWWCVLYPDLCFDANSNTISMSEESKEKLKNVLCRDDYLTITQASPKYLFKFKLLEIFSNLY